MAGTGARILSAAVEAFGSGAPDLRLNGNGVPELREARLTDADAVAVATVLAQRNPFTTLDLSFNALGGKAADALGKLLSTDRVLEVLDLSENDLTEAAVEALCAGLKGNTALRELRLSGNRIRGPGGMLVAEMLQVNNSIQRLYLANCELTTDSLVALSTVLHTNERMMVLDVQRPLIPCPMDAPSSHLSQMLKVNTTLVELDISKSNLRDFGLQLIAEELHRAGSSSALQLLRAKANHLQLVADDCVLALSRLLSSPTCRLSVLMLGANNLADDGALKLAEIVGANKSLLQLDVSSNSISSRGLCALGRSVSQHVMLQSMELWGNRFDSAACLAWLPALQMLKLDISVDEVDGSYSCVRN